MSTLINMDRRSVLKASAALIAGPAVLRRAYAANPSG